MPKVVPEENWKKGANVIDDNEEENPEEHPA